jgi:hypothetical protein
VVRPLTIEPGVVGTRTGAGLGKLPGTWKLGNQLGSKVFTKKATEDAPVNTW